MKTLIRFPEHRQQQTLWQTLLLIGLLLFLPLAQADHFEQHHNLPHDTHCQLYHATSDIDDLHGNLASIFVNNAIEWSTPHYQSTYQFSHHTLANIRAPPVNQ